MRPQDSRVWRKAHRAALKGIARGRRATHKVKTQEPDSTPRHSREWLRRWYGGCS